MPAGRPRSETAQAAILKATREELGRTGYDRLSIDRVAVVAGVAKQTVYRWYPTKSALVAECFLQGYVLAPSIQLKQDGSARDAIITWMREFATATQDPQVVALIRAASGAAAEDPGIARGFQDQMKTLARNEIATRIRDASESGEFRQNAPAEAVAEIIVGSLVYRLFTHEELTPGFVDDLAATVFDGIDGGRVR
jgi:AcrR family transcriptional regulator